MSQKVDIMFMKNYFPKFGTSFGNHWSQTIALHFAEYIDMYRELMTNLYSPYHRNILENCKILVAK